MVDRLLCLVIFLSICGFVLAWMCVSSVFSDALTFELPGHTPALFIMQFVCVFSCSRRLLIVAPHVQNVDSPINHQSYKIFSCFSPSCLLLYFHLVSLMAGWTFTSKVHPKGNDLKMKHFVNLWLVKESLRLLQTHHNPSSFEMAFSFLFRNYIYHLLKQQLNIMLGIGSTQSPAGGGVHVCVCLESPLRCAQ